MVAVMIKGFEMPRNCCFCSFERNKTCSVNRYPIADDERRPYTPRVSWCPLEEVNLREVHHES